MFALATPISSTNSHVSPPVRGTGTTVAHASCTPSTVGHLTQSLKTPLSHISPSQMSSLRCRLSKEFCNATATPLQFNNTRPKEVVHTTGRKCGSSSTTAGTKQAGVAMCIMGRNGMLVCLASTAPSSSSTSSTVSRSTWCGSLCRSFQQHIFKDLRRKSPGLGPRATISNVASSAALSGK